MRFIKVIQVKYLFTLMIILFSHAVKAEPLRIAVSANFHPVLSQLLTQFQQQNRLENNAYADKPIELISGASGVLYQQIRFGAPFDIFLSADALRPQQLITQNKAKADSLTTYAIGQLSLWSPKQTFIMNDLSHIKTKHNNIPTPRLAIANPKTAPYGQAAKQVLTQLKSWQFYQQNIITGININQTFQQVRSGSVAWGIVATSQLVLNNINNGLVIPHQLYSPIQQQGVILARSQQADFAQHFMAFLMSESIQKQLNNYGYLSVNQNLSSIQKVQNGSL